MSIASRYAALAEDDRREARARVMDALYGLAVVTASAHVDDAVTTNEAQSIAILCERFGQSEPLADQLVRLPAKGGAA